MNLMLFPLAWLPLFWFLASLGLTAILACGLYVLLFQGLRSLFRRFERDIALVALNVSAYPALSLFVLSCLKLTIFIVGEAHLEWLDGLIVASMIVAACVWVLQLFSEVVIYYLKEYSETTEALWDNVLIPLLEGAMPVIVIVLGSSAILQLCFGLDLTGAWLTLGGATFVVGLAVKDILANFFSGIVLLIDGPFQFGDVLRLEDKSLAMLRKIGLRVTQLYLFESHMEIYIPNSNMQNHDIINLSRPIEPVYYSVPIELNATCDLEGAKRLMKEVIQAHPDTLGIIDSKLDCLERYYDWDETDDNFHKKKENGRERLVLENQVNLKLEEIEIALEALMVTLQFAEKGGLNLEEIANIQQEYQGILELIGLQAISSRPQQRRSWLQLRQVRSLWQLEETQVPDSLIVLVREWYRIWLRDPTVVDGDQYVLPQIWERKITLLKRRVKQLYLKILHPQREETRLDDYVANLVRWLRNRFKQARSQWQEPEVRLNRVIHDEGYTYVEFLLNYYVDDIRLEDGDRGIRVKSDIQREILRHLKESALIYPL